MSKQCAYDNCTRIANYNYVGLYRFYCGKHKLPDMINVVSARCVYGSCIKSRIYNYPGLTAKYCGLHRVSGMVNCSRPLCKRVGCHTSANYGYNNGRDYCYRHKHPMMDKYSKCCLT